MNSKSIIGGFFLAVSVICACIVYKVNGGDISKFLSSSIITNVNSNGNINKNYQYAGSVPSEKVDVKNFMTGNLNQNKETSSSKNEEESGQDKMLTGMVQSGTGNLSAMAGNIVKEDIVSIIVTFFGVILCAVFGAIGIGLLVMGDREESRKQSE